MVYDPIRDCEVPSPSVVKNDPFKYPTPPSAYGGGYDRDEISPNGRPPLTQHSSSYSPPPPSGPGPSSLGRLLNDTPLPSSRRGSDRTGSVSSIPDEGDVVGEGSKSHLHRLLNNTSTPTTTHTQPISKTNSNSSLTRSSPSNQSPGSRNHLLDPNGFLTPATPASAYPRSSRSTSSRSPHPQPQPHPYPQQMSPPKATVPLPQNHHPQHQHEHGYPQQYGEPSQQSQRREQTGMIYQQGQRPMLPPQQPIHPHEMYPPYEQRTPGSAYQSLPIRSPSISLSPRSQHQQLQYNSSRPGSASSASHPFGYQSQPHSQVISPTTSTRRLSEDQARPTSSSSAGGRRYTDSNTAGPTPGRRSSQSSASGYPAPRLTPIRSPSPIVKGTPYNPNRMSQPGNIVRPIEADELAYYKSMSQQNNPLRKRKAKRPLPSWSGPSPGPKSGFPNEESSSYFPPQNHEEDQLRYSRSQSYADDRNSIGRPSVTPTPGSAYGGGGQHGAYPPAFEDQLVTPGGASRGTLTRGRRPTGNGNDSGHQNHLKRPSDRDEDGYAQGYGGHDVQRRKVSETHYVGNNAAVADHYNSRPEVGVEGREFSPIIGLKKFNNWIKSVLIGKFAHRPQGKVLDVGCGKGGDLNKWKQARIMLYVGLDIAETSIQQASERYQRMQSRFDGFFFAYDCFSKPLSEILPEQLQQKDLYDNVSMQFCMHYAFESASKVRMMIENVSRYLRTGGIFMGTIPNAELLLSKLNDLPEDDEELKFGNNCYFVQFQERKHKGIYGHQYRFYLQDAVEDVPEYIVDWENFVSLAMEYRLRLVYKKPFHDILQEEKESRDFGPLLGKMGVVNEMGESAMDEDQWVAANLYMGFAFEKM